MRCVVFQIAVLLCILFGLSNTTIAQSSVPTRESQEAVIDAWLATETDRNEVVPRRIDAISKELATIVQHDWAGEYRSGMPLGDYVTIVIAPDSGIGRTTFGCCGEGKPNCGRTRIDDLGVHVHWDYPCHPSFPEPRILVPIRWGDSRFLIPQNEISLFCIDAREHHRKNEPKAHSRRLTTRYLWQSNDHVLPSGKPQIPKAYQAYEDLGHISAQITSTHEPTRRPVYDHLPWYEFIEQRVKIDVGAKNHVLPGMQFWTNHKLMFAVTSVRDNDSDAVRVEKAIHQPDFTEELVGMRVSTESPYERIARK